MEHDSRPDLIAKRIIAAAKNNLDHLDDIETWIENQVKAAVRAERWACADVAAGYTDPEIHEVQTSRAIEVAIKRRGTAGTGYYMVAHLPKDKSGGMETLRAIFDDTVDYGANWLFLSTSGVHGSYTTLDEIETDIQRVLDPGSNCWDPDHDPGCACGAPWDDDNHPLVHPDGSFRITALVVKPRIVQSVYGTIWATVDDLPWLREVVFKTLIGVASSQNGNLPEQECRAAGDALFVPGQFRDCDVAYGGKSVDNPDDDDQCPHESVMPAFDEQAAEGMSSAEIKEKYPRFMGECPDCGQHVILYASFMHYICGDW
jgi:hypothetical protein